VAAAAAGNVMLIAVALYAGAGADPEVAQLFRWVSLLVTLPAVLWAGQTFFRGALAGLRVRTLHMDVPVSLALIGATVSSAYNTLRGSGEIYFDSVALLVFLLLVARWLQVRALRAASDASELLFSLAPSRARVVDPSGQVREVSVESLVAGQIAEVRAGEGIPVDGTVIEGQSRIDNALLTGEPMPVAVAAGSEVHAGAHNVAARLLVRITAAGEDTRVGRLLAAVSEAQRRRAPIVKLADRVAACFVFAVLLLAGLSAAVWWSAGPDIAAERAVAMLVITCPCALGLATPLALARALGLAARRGIFVKGADTVETLSRVDTVLLDKTGTLTHGRVALGSFEGSRELASRVAALEQHSAHPFARALHSAFPVAGDHQVEGVEDTAGAGIRGRVDRQQLVVGSPAFVRRWVAQVTPQWQARLRQAGERGTSPVLVAEAGRIAGLITFTDPLRADSAAAVHSLRRLGLGLSILSGDDPARVAEVARQLRVDRASAQGGLTPEAKLEQVRQLVAAGRVVAMVGDGVNDAAALAAAQVGIAVRGGAELSLATADVFLTQPGLPPAAELVRGARATLRVVRRNLGISLCYNLVGRRSPWPGWYRRWLPRS
jgi:Cu2+-exporting ATPase